MSNLRSSPERPFPSAVSRTAARVGRVTPRAPSGRVHPGTIKPQSRQKTPVLVLNQGSSRQTVKLLIALLPPAPIFNLALSLQPLAFCFKTPAIKANRASSRQTLNNQTAIMPPVLQPKTATPPTGRAGGAPPPHIPYSVWPATQSPEFGPPAGNPPPNVLFVTSRPCAFALKTQQSSLIKPNRTASRQP